MSLSISQIITVASSILSGIGVVVGDLAQGALLPAHVAAVVLAVVAAVSAVISTVNTVSSETNNS